MRAESLSPRDPRNPGDDRLRRELYFFTLYRVLEAGLFAFLVYSPLAFHLFPGLRVPGIGRTAAAGYLLIAAGLLLVRRSRRLDLETQVVIGLACDLAAATIAIYALPSVQSAAALLLIVNIGAGALLLRPGYGYGLAIAAALIVVGLFSYDALSTPDFDRPLIEPVMYAVTYLAIATLCHLIGKQIRETEALAERRGKDVASLAEISELVIRRMRTGVVVADAVQHIRLANETAWALLGHPSPDRRDLAEIAPELSRRLRHWRHDLPIDNAPARLATDAPEVIPHFTRLTLEGEEMFLIFLDDVALLSRRAEQMTLNALGRLSASIAHEIRNPLTAISYSTQLLQESPLGEADRHLLDIILGQCQRLNGIVQNILGLARRERSQPEALDLVAWARRFVEDYQSLHRLEHDHLLAVGDVPRLPAMIDPQHLHQAVSALVHNALTYGRLPGQPARVSVAARPDQQGRPMLEVIDRGPGISAGSAQRLFEPFYTTSEHGTGLGLYIARQLCEANQASLEFDAVPGGGSCFRILMPGVRSFMRPRIASA